MKKTLFSTRNWAIRCLNLATLSLFAITQPLLSLLARQPEFLAIREVSRIELLSLVTFLLVVPPLLLLAVERIVALFGSMAGAVAHGVVVVLLASSILLQTCKAIGFDRGLVTVLTSLVLASAFAIVERRRVARLFLTYLSISLIVLPLVFLLNPRVLRSTEALRSEDYELRSSSSETPIVMVVFDEFPLTSLLDGEGEINRRRYPRLAELADQSTFFTDSRAVTDITNFALPAILTGDFPVPDRLPTLADHPQNLFTLFGDSHDISANEPVAKLCPPEINQARHETEPRLQHSARILADLSVVWLHQILPTEQSSELPPITSAWDGFAEELLAELTGRRASKVDGDGTTKRKKARKKFMVDRAGQFRSFIESIRPESEPSIYFLHIALPHYPWEYLPSGNTFEIGRTPGIRKNRWEKHDILTVSSYQRFLMQLQFTDRLIGELVDRLRSLELFDKTLLILTADHGASFRPGDDRRFITPTNLEDIIRIPLLIKRPFQNEAELYRDPVSSIDILPTILEITGTEAPEVVDGRSVFAADRQPTGFENQLFSGTSRKTVSYELDSDVRESETLGWKLAHFGDGSRPGQFFELGGVPELAQRPLAKLEIVAAPDVNLNLREAQVTAAHDLAAPVSKSWISGSLALPEDDPACCVIAAAVDGRIEATSKTFGDDASFPVFTLALPEGILEAGQDRLEIFLVERGPSGVFLKSPAISNRQSLDVVWGHRGQVRALRLDGREVAIRKGFQGQVKRLTRKDDSVILEGWAVERKARELPDRLVLYEDSRRVPIAAEQVENRGVAAKFGKPELSAAGFRFVVPRSILNDLGRSQLRVYGVARNGQWASPIRARYLIRDTEPARLEGTDGRVFPIQPGKGGGFRFVPLKGKEDRWSLGLRVASPDGTAPESLALFVGERFITKISPGWRWMSDSMSENEFNLSGAVTLHHRLVSPDAVEAVRIFTLEAGGMARELVAEEGEFQRPLAGH